MQVPAQGVSGFGPGVALPGRRRDDARLSTLMSNFGEHGGIASSDEIHELMRSHWRQPISMLARWIVTRQLVNFTWRTQLLLPLFQFERPRMTPRESVVDAVRALADSFDDEGIALWFVEPNAWLQDARPVSVEVSDPAAVLDAALHARELRKRLQWPA